MKKKRLEAGQDFPRFLKHVRKEQNVLLEQLSRGLMTVSNLARIEKGQRPISKSMRDCLLGRLGIASDLYENMLNIFQMKEVNGTVEQLQKYVQCYDKQAKEKVVLIGEIYLKTEDINWISE